MADTELPQISSAVLIPDDNPTQPPPQEDTLLSDAPIPAAEPTLQTQPPTTTSAPSPPNITSKPHPTSHLPLPSSSTKRRPSTSPPAPSKRPRRADDLARNRRLFGSLLSTLSSASTTTTTSTQKRRASIEARQQEKLRAQAEEYDALQRRERARVGERRREEQVVWEGWERQVRYEELRGKAGSLRTRTVPVLYYKPYSLLRHEKAQIERQIRQVEEDIERELDEVDERRTEALARQRRNADYEERERGDDVMLQEKDRDDMMPRENDRDDRVTDEPMTDMNTIDNGREQEEGKGERVNGVAHEEAESTNRSRHVELEGSRDVAEDNDEMVVEAGEDAVIY